MISGSSGKRRIRAILFYFSRTLKIDSHTLVAQQVEHPAVNREVEGSSPSMGATKTPAKKQALFAAVRDGS